MKKKFLAITIALILSFSLTLPSLATNPYSSIEKDIEVNGYNFTISETSAPSYMVTRTYTSPKTRAVRTIDETKALLAALGLEARIIESLSPDELQLYATSEQIFVSNSYSKSDAVTNETTYLPKEVALSSAEELTIQQEEYYDNYLNNPTSDITPYGNMPNNSNVPGEFKDSYMQITNVVSHQGGGSLYFHANAKWLTLPWFRGYDSLGVSAMDCSLTTNSGNCTFKYTEADIVAGYDTIYRNKKQVSSGSQLQVINDSGWCGSAGMFYLPSDDLNTDIGATSYKYSNFEVDLTYSGHIASPSEPRYYFVLMTYDHSIFNVNLGAPTIGINNKGELSGSIGISISRNCDTRLAGKEYYYPGRQITKYPKSFFTLVKDTGVPHKVPLYL